MAESVPRWESELWSCVCSSDGESCPRYNHFHSRHKGYLCPCDYLGHFRQLLDAKEFSPCNYDFVEHVENCKMLKLVEKLANRYLDSSKIDCPPFPMDLVSLFAEDLPIEVRLVPLRNHHGATWHLEDSWIIQLSSNDIRNIQRLTLFHEAFHIIAHLRGTSVPMVSENNRGPFTEMLAEHFSGCILMPMKWVREKWAETHDLDAIVEIFGVPKPLAYMRLKFLHLLEPYLFKPPSLKLLSSRVAFS